MDKENNQLELRKPSPVHAAQSGRVGPTNWSDRF